MVYRWADPDSPAEPSVAECVALDLLYVEEVTENHLFLHLTVAIWKNARMPHTVMKASERFCDVMHEAWRYCQRNTPVP